MYKLSLLRKEYFDGKIIPEANEKEHRIHLYLPLNFNNLYFLIPFESNLFLKNSVAHYRLPTCDRPNAGLNFEKVIILEENELGYINFTDIRIPRKQLEKIEEGISEIEKKFERYLNNFIKACQKKRERREFKYRYSTLHYYKELLYTD